jgi:hypothetical protein
VIPYDHLSLDVLSSGGAASGNPAGTIVAVTNLLTGTQYANPRYFPAVAARRTSTLAGQSPYAEVEDVITVDVLGSTAGACMANAQELLALLDQAAEWAGGANVLGVQVRARAQGAAAAWGAMILGPAPGTSSAALAPVYDVPAGLSAACWILRDFEIRFVRRGRWISLSVASESASSAYANLGNIYTATTGLTAQTIGTPTVLTLQGETTGTDVVGGVTLLVAQGAGRLASVQAGDGLMPGGAGYSAVVVGASFGTSVLRFTTAVPGAFSTPRDGTTVLATTQLVGGALTIRNNSAGTTWLVQLELASATSFGLVTDIQRTAPVVVTGASTSPQVIAIPPVALRSVNDAAGNISVGVVLNRVVGTGSTTIDIDVLEICLKFALPSEHHARKSLVDLDKIDLVKRHLGALQHALRCRDYAGKHHDWINAANGKVDETRTRAQSKLLGTLNGHQQRRARTIGDLTARTGCQYAFWQERWLKRSESLQRSGANTFVTGD